MERIIERLRVEVATLDLRSEEGIDTDEELVQQMLKHVQLGYGEAVAAGPREEAGVEEESVWASSLQGETLVKEVPVDAATGEATVDTLVQEVATLEADQE